MVSGILAAMAVSFRLAQYYKIEKDSLFDLSFWLIINGLLGARIYDVFLQLNYYLKYPLDTFKIWQGGLAIHGAIIAGLITIYFFSKKQKINFWFITALIVPGLALGQSIGRFGNYFNQELFGLPTAKPWGIPIDILNRPLDFLANSFFQPTFLYESLGCLLIFIILASINYLLIRQKKISSYYCVLLTALYVILYSVLRFCLEFIKVDTTPIFLGLRWPQVISLIMILLSIILLIFNSHAKKEERGC